MNTLCQKIAAVFSLALSLSLVSCEKDNLLTPTPSGSARQGAGNDIPLPSPNLPQTPRLIKYGEFVLSYSDNGRLRKVTTDLSKGGIDAHTDYTYAPNSIRAAAYQGLTLVRDETFILDASGRCAESVVKGSFSDTHWIYTYNAKGQLSSCQNKNSCVGGASYTYNSDGDLIHVNVATDPSGGMGITVDYVLPMDANSLFEKYPLNLNGPLLPKHDTFLPIFGKPGKHLVKRMSYSPSGVIVSPTPNDRFYTYVTKPDGYVIERNMAHTFGGNSVEKTPYEYELANMKLK